MLTGCNIAHKCEQVWSFVQQISTVDWSVVNSPFVLNMWHVFNVYAMQIIVICMFRIMFMSLQLEQLISSLK